MLHGNSWTARITDRGTIKTHSKHDTDRLKRHEVKQEYVNKCVTHVEETESNINWKTLQQMQKM
jgi:hypothetical protein